MSTRLATYLALLIVAATTSGAACGALRSPSAGPAAVQTPNRIGEFVWQDLMTEDSEKSRAFYEQLFGWQFERTNRLGRPYLIARLGSVPVGGIAQVERRRPDEPIAQWLSYLLVADVDAVAARVSAAGGRMLVAPTDVNQNRAAVAVDPQGAPFGLVKLGPAVTLPAGGPSAPVGTFFWRDYLAKDVELARTFYSDIAGLGADRQARPDSLLHYVLTRPGPFPVAGVVPIGERQIVPNWLTYIRVDNPSEVATRAEKLGARILLGASPDIRNGSVSVIADPSGAAVALQKWPF